MADLERMKALTKAAGNRLSPIYGRTLDVYMVTMPGPDSESGRHDDLTPLADSIYNEVWWKYHQEWWHPSCKLPF